MKSAYQFVKVVNHGYNRLWINFRTAGLCDHPCGKNAAEEQCDRNYGTVEFFSGVEGMEGS